MIRKIRTFLMLTNAAGLFTVLRWKLLPKNKEFIATIANFRVLLRAGTSDLPIAIECLTSEYEALGRLFSHDFEGVIVDAGGHIGCASLKLASLYPRARIICIEPASDNIPLLRENTRNFPRIDVRQAALVASPTAFLVLSDRGLSKSGYTVVSDIQDTSNATQIEKVLAISISELITEFGDDLGFLKLDIEGAECDILKLSSFRDQDIPAVFVELHDRIKRGCSEAFGIFSAGRWTLRLGSEKYLSLSRKRVSPDLDQRRFHQQRLSEL